MIIEGCIRLAEWIKEIAVYVKFLLLQDDAFYTLFIDQIKVPL